MPVLTRGSDRRQAARAALEDGQLAHAELVEELERLVVVAPDVLGGVGVAGEHDRVAGVEHHLQEGARGVQLADRLAQPGGRDLDGDARLGDALHGDLVVVAQVALGPRALRGPQYLTMSGWARMSNRPLIAASPSHSKYVRQTLSGDETRRQMSYVSWSSAPSPTKWIEPTT